MSYVICSCLLADNTNVRLRLSQLLHNEIDSIYGECDKEEPCTLCEIELQGCRRDFFENKTGETLAIGEQVVVESDGGYDFGIVYSTGRITRKKVKLKGLESSNVVWPTILRLADSEDKKHIEDCRKRQSDIRDICLKKIQKHALELKLVDVELRMDQQKLSVYYTSSHRVDFRNLVRDLAGEFKARIQMVQITTREEARRANAFGPCGCLLCCSSWLQKIHANPFAEKSNYHESSCSESHAFNITGLCNRPKCCIGYTKQESSVHDNRQQHEFPPVGSRLSTPDGPAIVESIDTRKKLVCLFYQKGEMRRRFPIEKFNSLFIKK
ncbi:MAG: hypothetical protein HGA72_04935 [Chlorobiaceae bacterium]|nr:hypothetical protein [Chlorobiaceae bacterium]NTW62560.1 hypothetical protein [Chlorobiaceae bacterium]